MSELRVATLKEEIDHLGREYYKIEFSDNSEPMQLFTIGLAPEGYKQLVQPQFIIDLLHEFGYFVTYKKLDS